jgi:integrase
VDRVTAKTIEQWIEKRRAAGVELVTLKKVMLTLGAVLRYAVRHRYITHNPISCVERPRGPGKAEEPAFQVLQRDQIEKLIEATDGPKFKTLFYLAVMSGARQGELFGLKWSDALWMSDQIQRTFNHGEWYRPKSKSSARWIDLGPKVMAALKRRRLACPPTSRTSNSRMRTTNPYPGAMWRASTFTPPFPRPACPACAFTTCGTPERWLRAVGQENLFFK